MKLPNRLRRHWKGLLLFLAVAGPGIITSNVDNDAGGIATYSMAGAHFGYALLWSLIPIMLALIIVQEMSARMGVVTGKGLSDLIRERFGVRITVYLLVGRRPDELRQRHRRVRRRRLEPGDLPRLRNTSPSRSAAVFVWLLVVKGTYRSVEKIFLYACLFYVTYILAGFLAKPDWGAIGRELRPRRASTFSPGSLAHDHRPRRDDHRALDAVLPPGLDRREEHRRSRTTSSRGSTSSSGASSSRSWPASSS